jgi:tetratricopeptide (TPR) repeat protein
MNWKVVACGLSLWLVVAARAAPPATNSTAPVADDINWARHVVQAYEEYQRQQRATAALLEQTRQDAARAAQSADNSAAQLEARLLKIEQALSLQRQREIENLQEAQRSTLLVVGTVAAVGLVCMMILALLLLRTMNRRMETVLAPFAGAVLAPAAPAAAELASGATDLTPADPAAQSSARFVSALDQLEQRVTGMENDLAAPLPASPTPTEEAVALEQKTAHIAALLGKGQTFLNMDKLDEAIACFDEVLALDPKYAEALVKKGTALEKIGKLDEAIQYYDRAIEADQNMTLAYLCKGGVFNRLERYNEALACYEKALRAKEKSGVA